MPKITLLHIDCMEYMATVASGQFDLAIVDPPYGIGIVSQLKKTVASGSSMMRGMNGIVGGEWDNAIPDRAYFDELRRVSKNQIIWGGNYFIDHLRSTRCFISWDKMNGTNNMADFELAWASFDSSCRRFSMHHFSAGYDTKIHPTQKPVALYRWLLSKYANRGDVILDTHLGSGSIAIACDIEGYDLVGCEIDEGYIEAARLRLAQHQRQLGLFRDNCGNDARQLCIDGD